MRWLDNYGELVAAQLASRSSLGPNSIGAVEAVLRQVERAFLGRSQSFGNRAGFNNLLKLTTLLANGDADSRRWADRLRERLHPRGGIPPSSDDDPRACPSLPRLSDAQRPLNDPPNELEGPHPEPHMKHGVHLDAPAPDPDIQRDIPGRRFPRSHCLNCRAYRGAH